MKKMSLFLILLTVSIFDAKANQSLYDCNSSQPEAPGFHNMVLFGNPEDKVYTYHLPLFKGKINGEHGHVMMHVYQGIWEVELDQETMNSYKNKFMAKKSLKNPFPFFLSALEEQSLKFLR